MEELAEEMRRLVYTVICFQCLLQLTEGTTYQKYLKIFSHLLILCICCSVVLDFCGVIENSYEQTQAMCESWEAQWNDLGEIYEKSDFLEEYMTGRIQEAEDIGTGLETENN